MKALECTPYDRAPYTQKGTFDKPSIRKNFRCCNCNNEFVSKSPYQLFCSIACEKIDEQKKQEISNSLLWKNCLICGIKFRKKDERSAQANCDCCKRQKARQYHPQITEIDRWVKSKKRKGISLEELIRRQEWKRVWDDAGWDHYLSGKKYDRI